MTGPASASPLFSAAVVRAVRNRLPIHPPSGLYGRITDGGTYLIGINPDQNIDGYPRDLMAVLPIPLNGRRVIALSHVDWQIVAFLEAKLAQ